MNCALAEGDFPIEGIFTQNEICRGDGSQQALWRLLTVEGLWDYPRFPVGDEAYHTYTETSTFLQQTAQNYPSVEQLSSVGL